MGINKKVVMTGISLAALAGAAGAYFVYGKNAARNRKRIKGWTLKLKGEVLERMEKIKDANEETYNELVDQVTDRYRTMKDVNKKELMDLGRELKAAWKHFKIRDEGRQ